MRILPVVGSFILIAVMLAGCGTVSQVQVNPQQVTLQPGETRQLKAIAYSRSGEVRPGVAIRWNSSNPSVATVDADGTVRAVGPGNARITAVASGNVPGEATVIVAGTPTAVTPTPPVTMAPSDHEGISRAVARVTVTPARSSIAVGERVDMRAQAMDAAGVPISGADYYWTSSDPNVASVNMIGQVTGVGPGTARIMASEAGKTGMANITVTGTRTSVIPTPPEEQPPAPPVAIQPTTPPATTQPARPRLTYTSTPSDLQLKPIIDQRCASCHRTGGARAQSPLTTYEQIKPQVDSSVWVSKLNGSMAPYAGEYRDELIAWAQQGAPR